MMAGAEVCECGEHEIGLPCPYFCYLLGLRWCDEDDDED